MKRPKKASKSLAKNPRASEPIPFVPTQTAHDLVNHPKHYTCHPSGIEAIEIVRHMTFNVGNAVKYCWRAGLKGSTVEDLRKAIWYLTDEVKRLEMETRPREH